MQRLFVAEVESVAGCECLSVDPGWVGGVAAEGDHGDVALREWVCHRGWRGRSGRACQAGLGAHIEGDSWVVGCGLCTMRFPSALKSKRIEEEGGPSQVGRAVPSPTPGCPVEGGQEKGEALFFGERLGLGLWVRLCGNMVRVDESGMDRGGGAMGSGIPMDPDRRT